MSKTIVDINEKHSQKTGDSFQLRPRAVIAIFPYLIREIDPFVIIVKKNVQEYADYLNLRNKVIIIVDDVLNMSINTVKGGPNHTLQTTLAPLGEKTDYLQRVAPGDYVMAWIVNGTKAVDELIEQLKNAEPCNDYKSGLKFFGQLMNIQESFRANPNGVKSLRYNLSASGFNQYNAQIYYSPFITPKDSTNSAAFLFAKSFYKTLEDNVVNKLYSTENGTEPLSIHKQFKALHKLLLGPGPNNGVANLPIKSINGAFGVPTEVSKTLGRKISASAKESTYADLCSVLLGVQQFPGSEGNEWGPLGPQFDLETSVQFKGNSYGAYWEPMGSGKEDYFLKGRKLLKISPTIGGTVHSLLQQVSNPTINEMYFTLRPEPTAEATILPTLVCRQLPFVTHLIEDVKAFTYTKYFDLPRFMIPSDIVIAYDLSRNDALRLNATMVRQDGSLGKPNYQDYIDAVAIQYGNWAFDPNDVKRHGLRFYPVKLDQDLIPLDNKKSAEVIRKYTAFLSSVISNQHLKYTGTISTFGIFDPICIGENVEFNNIVLHIEGVQHAYQVQNGLPLFRTTLTLSHGIHKNGDLDALQEVENYEPFTEMRDGIIKEGNYKTIILSTSREDTTSSSNSDFGNDVG